MEHRGEIIKKAVYKSGYSITELAKTLGKSRRWVYFMFENNNVPLDLLLQIGIIIRYDFSEEIKELKNNIFANKPSPTHKIENETADYWKNKYLLLLEEYNELLKKKGI